MIRDFENSLQTDTENAGQMRRCGRQQSRRLPSAAKTIAQRGSSAEEEATLDVTMKYWEIIADNLSKAGWSWGCVSAIDSNGRTIWIADAHRGDGRRFVVRNSAIWDCGAVRSSPEHPLLLELFGRL